MKWFLIDEDNCVLCFGRVDSMVVDIGPPADWVKINVRKTVSSFTNYGFIYLIVNYYRAHELILFMHSKLLFYYI